MKSVTLLLAVVVSLSPTCAQLDTHRYHLNLERRDYFSALKYCLDRRMSLISVENAADRLKVLHSTFGKNSYQARMWFDASDVLVEGRFVSLDGALIRNIKWAALQPDNWYGGREHCLGNFGYTGAHIFNDFRCNHHSKLITICQRDDEINEAILKRRKQTIQKMLAITNSKRNSRLFLRFWINERKFEVHDVPHTYRSAVKHCKHRDMNLYLPDKHFQLVYKKLYSRNVAWVNSHSTAKKSVCQMMNRGKFTDADCNKKLRYICEAHDKIMPSNSKEKHNAIHKTKRESKVVFKKIKISIVQEANRIVNNFC